MSTAVPGETVAYKILTNEQLARFLIDGAFRGAPVDIADGYIHLSTAGQVRDTLDKHFAGQADLYIAAVDLTLLGESVRWEVSRGGALFPHLYSDLPLSAVIAHGPVELDASGKLCLPAPLR